MPQRRAKIVGHRITEGFQLLVRRLKQLTLASQFCRDAAPIRNVVMNEIVHGAQENELQHAADQFRDHYLGKGEPRLDWDRSFNTWLRNEIKFDRKPKPAADQPYRIGRG